MGLFSSKTKHYVSSSVWNLAGDDIDRIKFLPSVILTTVMTGGGISISEGIRRSLWSTTSLRTRAFYHWARRNYIYGVASGRIGTSVDVLNADLETPLRAALSLPSSRLISMTAAAVGPLDIDIWAEHLVAQYHPLLLEDEWEAAIDAGTSQIVIETPDAVFRYPAPSDLMWALNNLDRELLYISYRVLTKASDGLYDAGPLTLFTYRMGSGNTAFDALAVAAVEAPGEFYPALPLRIDNTSLSDMEDETYEGVRKAFKKLTGGKISEVLEKIDDHEKVGDMDHVFVQPGVSLNTKEQSGLSFLYEFFKELARLSPNRDFKEEQQEVLQEAVTSEAAYRLWAGTNVRGGAAATPEAAEKAMMSFNNAIRRMSMKERTLEVKMPDLPRVRCSVSWVSIEETIHAGNAARFDGSTTRKALTPGKFISGLEPKTKFQVGTGTLYDEGVNALSAFANSLNIGNGRPFVIMRQIDAFTYRKLTVRGLRHQNYVYKNHSVKTSAEEAFEEEDEDSGFIIPLHYPTLLKMSQLRRAELMTCSTFLIINCHVKKKVKWYQRGIFKVILAIAGIAISVFTGGASLGATVGLLGTNAAVGAAIGLAGTMAALAGAAVNAVAALILTSIISRVSVKLLGEKWGAIIGTLVSFVAFQYGRQTFGGGEAFSWDFLMKPQNLIEVTKSVTNAYTNWVNADTLEIYGQMEEAAAKYKDELQAIREQAHDILGMTNVVIDPMLITDATEHFKESSETFLNRTLFTGDDLVELSQALIENFAEVTLELPRAFAST